MISREPGQPWCSCQAVTAGLDMSRRPWIKVPGMPEGPQNKKNDEDRRVGEAVVGPVVSGQAHEGMPEAIVVPAWVALEAAGADGDVRVLPQRPLVRGRVADGGIG